MNLTRNTIDRSMHSKQAFERAVKALMKKNGLSEFDREWIEDDVRIRA